MDIYTAHDIGPAIEGKHIDVYTGEGLKAYEGTRKLTSRDNEVCVLSM